MAKNPEKKIVKRINPTQYISLKMLPRGLRDDVYKLHSFIRAVNELVDSLEPDTESFKHLIRRWQELKKLNDFGRFELVDNTTVEHALASLSYLVNRFELETVWVDDFLKAKAMDLRRKSYTTIRDTVEYINGSAEVVALIQRAEYGWAVGAASIHLFGSLLMTGLGILTIQKLAQ